MQNDLARRLDQEFASLPLGDRLARIATFFPETVFTTSLGPEDQLLTHAIASSGTEFEIAILQTGRLFAETLELIAETKDRYRVDIVEYHPEPQRVRSYVEEFGLNGFYNSVEARHACCHIRKIEPLGRALAGKEGWITGVRRQQSAARQNMPFVEWSADHRLMKINPLADWTLDELNQAIRENDIPVNRLHASGYPSIGCEPCTRAVKPGESERAGRWWWEQDQRRECGLHVKGAQTPPTSNTSTAVEERTS